MSSTTSKMYNFTRHGSKISIYTRFPVKNSMRARPSPRVAKAWRTRKLMNLTAFFRNRFYEIDRWYKARIEKPESLPQCYLIDPDNHYKSLAERLEELDLEKHQNRQLIDIGPFFDEKSLQKSSNRKDLDATELERLARLRKLHLEPREIENDHRNRSISSHFIRKMAEHCDIFGHLFHPDAYFYPSPDFRVFFADSQVLNPIFCGNTLKAADAIQEPLVEFSTAKNDEFYTLMMVNLDGNIYEENREVLHWLVSNIPGNDVSKGETLCPYLQPLPLKNTGCHRICFVIFEQESKIDDYALEKMKISHPQNFAERTFNAPDFYLKNQDQLTPVGLAFCQTEWDKSCTTCFHEILNMEQPIYDFEWPKPHFEEQEEFPEEYKNFNEYLDQYRDYKDVDKEIFQKRLKRISPFENESKKMNFPNIFYYDERTDLPTWRQLEKIRQNQGYGKYSGLYRNPIDN